MRSANSRCEPQSAPALSHAAPIFTCVAKRFGHAAHYNTHYRSATRSIERFIVTTSSGLSSHARFDTQSLSFAVFHCAVLVAAVRRRDAGTACRTSGYDRAATLEHRSRRDAGGDDRRRLRLLRNERSVACWFAHGARPRDRVGRCNARSQRASICTGRHAIAERRARQRGRIRERSRTLRAIRPARRPKYGINSRMPAPSCSSRRTRNMWTRFSILKI